MATIALMEAVSTSEMSVSIYQTTYCNIPQNNHLHATHEELETFPTPTALHHIINRTTFTNVSVKIEKNLNSDNCSRFRCHWTGS
jgi:hypothetical protein